LAKTFGCAGTGWLKGLVGENCAYPAAGHRPGPKAGTGVAVGVGLAVGAFVGAAVGAGVGAEVLWGETVCVAEGAPVEGEMPPLHAPSTHANVAVNEQRKKSPMSPLRA
jgi:hypothetical protein